MDRNLLPNLLPGNRHPDWMSIYQSARESALPWHFSSLDPDVEKELKKLGSKSNRILDAGCGLGHQADRMAELGFEVVGTDISPSAVERAQINFVRPMFLVDDITESRLAEPFDVVVDRGCFHVLSKNLYPHYLTSVTRLLNPGGWLLLKCLSAETGIVNFGPERFTLGKIHSLFAEKFRVARIHRTVFHGSTEKPPRAWFCVMQKREGT